MAIGETFSHLDVTFSAFVGEENVNRRVILRELSFDDLSDSSQVESIVKGMERSGWEIHSVMIYTDNDYLNASDIKDAGTLSAVFHALFEAPDNAGKLISYGELFGWQESHFEMTRYGRAYDEGFYGVYDTAEEFAQEFVENDEELRSLLTHPYVSVDWEATADNLMNDFASHEYGYELYIFANH